MASNDARPSVRGNIARPRSRRRYKFSVRLAVQILFFALIALISVNHSLAESSRGVALFSTASGQYVSKETMTRRYHEARHRFGRTPF